MILAPDGTPVTSAPAEAKEATLADLNDLLARMGVVADRMGALNPNRQMLQDAAWWLSMLAQQVVTLTEQAKLKPLDDHLRAALEGRDGVS